MSPNALLSSLALAFATAFAPPPSAVAIPAFALAPALGPVQGLGAAPLETEPAPSPQERWRGLIERDDRIRFTRRSAFDGRTVLEDRDSLPSEQAAALMAIGSTEPQPIRERTLLEDWTRKPEPLLRHAALLALGEFGEGGEAGLLDALEDVDPIARGCAMLGLLRSGRRSSRLRVEVIAQGQSADAAMAGQLLVFVLDSATSRSNQVLELFLQLRWDAARLHGLVDGESWRARLIADLVQEPLFLNAVVLLSAGGRTELGVKDHLLSTLLTKPGEAELRAAVRGLPDELAMMIETELWRPADLAAWRILLNEIELGRTEDEALALLGAALEVPELEVEALRLLARAGLPEPLVGLEDQWPSLTPGERRLAAEAWGYAANPTILDFLDSVLEDENLSVRASLRLVMARLGDSSSHEEFRAILENKEHPEYRATLAAAIAQADAPLIRGYLEDRLGAFELDERVDVLGVLALRGVSSARVELAAGLREGFPPGRRGARCVRALLVRDAAEYVQLFRDHFPAEDDLILNIALGRALVDARDDLALQFLRHALWTGPWDRSVLAALVLRDVGGPHSLRDELNRIPRTATSRDLRRIGFALGEWIGLDAVHYLKERESLMLRSPILQGAILGALGRRTH